MPSDATIPYGFKESQSKAKRDVCQFWGDPAHRDFQKNQERGGLPWSPLQQSRRKALKMVFSYSLSRLCGDGMASSNCCSQLFQGSPDSSIIYSHNNIKEEVLKFRQLGD